MAAIPEKTEAQYKRYMEHSMSLETWFTRGMPIIEHSNQNMRRSLTENVSGPPSVPVVCYPVQSYGQSEIIICEKKRKKLYNSSTPPDDSVLDKRRTLWVN